MTIPFYDNQLRLGMYVMISTGRMLRLSNLADYGRFAMIRRINIR